MLALGYVILDGLRDDVPAGILSASRCIQNRIPSVDEWTEGMPRARELAELFARDELAYPDSFASPTAAERFLSEGLRLMGIGVREEDARRVLDAGSADNALALLARRVPLAAGGASRGFEIVGFEGGLSHSFRCSNAHVSADKLGIALNAAGLFDREVDAAAALDWIRTEQYALEGGVWIVVELVEYASFTRAQCSSDTR